ncbi:unnamed protein product [Linum trigynum]|uniref:Uncharacterized protein n=1 Tax=Linum trigynum TaxID=586398 RepID=A0AAV2FYY9_9ROSI
MRVAFATTVADCVRGDGGGRSGDGNSLLGKVGSGWGTLFALAVTSFAFALHRNEIFSVLLISCAWWRPCAHGGDEACYSARDFMGLEC